MADDTKPPGPLTDLIKDAQDGNLTVTFGGGGQGADAVRVNADEFVYIDRDCDAFKEEIRALQILAQRISDRNPWGLGETTDGLTSASALVGRFRGKAKIVDGAKDGSNNVYDILEQHYQIVDEIQTLHRTIAQKFIETDQAFAAEYNKLMADKPPSQIGTTLVQPGVTAPPAVGAPK
ncbi:hypothetical protein [Nocardia mexicana]|uniref:Excreted virulence factor EspC (Type VII ESX diderm) n=1 Tax=Nocardia mexicana TaxID=279262 RepID=A0A370HBB1_9NOCA|nr:hypothetical protein [Nocardia mexicana]RDI54208.1 hypothetical protein DFR68_102332 [Nocardia mexicana]